MASELKKRALHGLAWSAVERFGMQGIQFVIALILARLLSPADYGLVGMLTIFIAIAQSFINSGFGTALIQKKNPTREDYSTVFYFNMVVSFFFYGVLFFAAPAIADFYQQPLLIDLTRVVALSFVINAMGLIQFTLLTKKIDFKTQSKVSISAIIISGSVGVFMAFSGFGVWALVAQTLISALARTVLVWIFNDWRPQKVFSLVSFKSLFAFGSRLLAAGLLDTVFKNIYLIVIGKLFNASALGFFTQAKKIQELPVFSITTIVQRVSFPIFSEVQDDRNQLKQGYQKTIRWSVFLVFPLMMGLAAIAPTFIEVVLTKKWMPSVPYLQLLCFAGMLYPVHALNLNLINVLGRSDLFLRLEIIKKTIISLSIIIGLYWGVMGLVIGSVVTSFIALWINTWYTGRLIEYGTSRQVADMVPYFIVSVLMAIMVYGLSYLLETGIILLGLQMVGGVLGYYFLVRIFRLKAYAEIKVMLLPYVPNCLKFVL